MRPSRRPTKWAVGAAQVPTEGKVGSVDDRRLETARAVSTSRLCAGCGTPLVGGRPQRRYCTGRCRARASRARHAQESDADSRVETMTPSIPVPLLLTADETAHLLRTTRKGVYAMIARGQLPGVTRLGSRVLIHRDDLLRWLDRSRTSSPKE